MNHIEQQDQPASSMTEDEGDQEDYQDNSVQNEEENFVCLKCKITFKTKSEQTEHALTHRDDEHVESQECEEEFIPACNLTRHDQPHSEDSHRENVCECKKCGRMLSWESNISKHIHIHTSDVNMNSQESCAAESNMTDCDEGSSFSCEESFEEDQQNQNSTEESSASICHIKMEPSDIKNNMSNFDEQETSASVEGQSEGNQKTTFRKQTKFGCPDCGKIFDMKNSLDKHAVGHLGVRKFECQECGKKFTEKSHLTQHDVLHSGTRDFECEECGKAFNQKSNLTTHMLIHSGVRNYECPHCDRKFIQKSHLVEHMLLHDDVKTYECKICYKSYSLKSTFSSHMRTHTAKKVYECTECRKNFSRKAYLERHISEHSCPMEAISPGSVSDSDAVEDTGLRNNKNCLEQQDQSSSSVMKVEQDDPVTDIPAHTEMENLECPGCGITFDTKSELVDHALMQCDIGNFQCSVCGKRFTHKSNLTRHLIIHTGVKNHECAECGKKFFQKGNLKQHILTHRGECNYVCKKCGKNFFLLSSLVKHSHVHNVAKNYSQGSDNSKVKWTVQSNHVENSDVAMEGATIDNNVSGSDLQETSVSCVSESVGDKENHLVTDTYVHEEETKFECSDCGESFETRSKLVAHTLKHSSARIFECQECSKVFTYKSNLTRHLMLHSGVKNYECEQCGKKFNQKGNLNQHLLTHRGDKNYVCHRCGEKFYLKCSLTMHRCAETNAWNDDYQNSQRVSISQHNNISTGLTSQSKHDANSNVAAYIIVDGPKQDSNVSSLDLQEQSSSNVSQPVSDHVDPDVTDTFAYKQEKRYECQECGKKFTFRSNLTRHSLIHSGVRNYECVECGKRFSQKGNLNQHMILHQGLKTYNCGGCGQTFNLKCALSKHVCAHVTL